MLIVQSISPRVHCKSYKSRNRFPCFTLNHRALTLFKESHFEGFDYEKHFIPGRHPLHSMGIFHLVLSQGCYLVQLLEQAEI